MAKLSQKLAEKREMERREVARRENGKLFMDACRSAGYQEIPEEILKLVNIDELPRLNSVTFVGFDKATELKDCRTFGTEDKDKLFCTLVQEKGKPFPSLFIHSPSFNKAKWSDEVYKIIARDLKAKYKVEALPENIQKAVQEIPYSTDNLPNFRYDGSQVRVWNLSLRESHKLYGDCITVDTSRIPQEWTIFIPEIDPVKAMQKHLANTTGLDEELTLRIAEAIGVEDYFGISKVYKDSLEYAKAMARQLKLSDGENVTCLLQGELSVFTDEDGKTAVDIDDEEPAVIVTPCYNPSYKFKGYLNIFVPASETKNEDAM